MTNKDRNLKNKIMKAVAPITAIAMMGGLTACSKNKTIEEPTSTTIVQEVVENNDVPSIDLSQLDITNNDSIDYVAEQHYLNYELFYVTHGITKDDIIDMILVINNRVVDEEGNLLVPSDRVSTAISNIDTVLLPDDLTYSITLINEEVNGELADEIRASANLIPTIPNLSECVDRHSEEANVVISHIDNYSQLVNNVAGNLNAYEVYHFPQFEDMRDSSINPNTVMAYYEEPINQAFFNLENNDLHDFDNVNGIGSSYILNEISLDICNLTSQVNQNDTYITDPVTGNDYQINPRSVYVASNNNIRTDLDAVQYVITMDFSGLEQSIPEDILNVHVEAMTRFAFAKYYFYDCNLARQLMLVSEQYGNTNNNTLTYTN